MQSISRLIGGHLSERSLLAAWVSGARPVHLDECGVCRNRYVTLVAELSEQRTALEEAADAVFTPERLAAQQSHILRRLENLARPVRVLPFPLPQRVPPAVHRVGRQWVAMAAAAGLVIGLALGLTVNFHPFGSDFAQPGLTGQTASQRPSAAARAVTESGLSDELFLTELESAVLAPRVRELQAIDALTPRVRETALVVR